MLFLSDLNEEIGSLSKVNIINSKFESYELETIEGHKFIVGKGKPEFLKQKELTMDGVDLLFSLINLVKDPLPLHLNKQDVDPIISDEDIMKWVEKYGIPYNDRKLNSLLNDKLIRPKHLYLESFKHRVAWLYSRFTLWKALIEEDSYEIDKYKYAARTLKFIKDMDAIENPNNQTDGITLIKKALAHIIGMNANIHLEFHYDCKTDKNSFICSANSLLDIAYFQLASLLTKPLNDSKQSLKNCKRCNAIFWAKHKNSKYCLSPGCNRKNQYYHNKKTLK